MMKGGGRKSEQKDGDEGLNVRRENQEEEERWRKRDEPYKKKNRGDRC